MPYATLAAKVKIMRLTVIMVCLLVALTVRGVTPEVGKDKLRMLVKLPTISFQPDWTFDAERGFALGSGAVDTRTEITDVRKALKFDPSDAERQLRLAELYAAVNETTNSRNAWTRAVGFYRQRVELQPDDGVLLGGFIALLAVRPEAAGQGLGTALIAHIAARVARKRRWLYVSADGNNRAALRFYRRLGFQRVGRLPDLVRAGRVEILLRRPAAVEYHQRAR